jgi:hypothetical protein
VRNGHSEEQENSPRYRFEKMVNELGINGSKNIEKKRCTAELTAYEKKQRIN